MQADDDGVPMAFYCPITRDIMEEPVVAADGFTCEQYCSGTVTDANRLGSRLECPGGHPCRQGCGTIPQASTCTCPCTPRCCPSPPCLSLCFPASTYCADERAAIESWLQRRETSPKTNLRLANRTLIPNRMLQAAIQEWGEAHEDLRS